MRALAQNDVLAAETDQLRCPETGLQSDQEDSVVPPAGPRRAIRCREQCCDLVAVEEGHAAFDVPLVGHRKDLLAVQQVGWLADGNKAEEGPDRRQPRIPAARAVAASGLDMEQEVADELGIEILDPKSRWRVTCPLVSEAEQQAERVAVAGDRIGTCLHLGAKAIGEESLEQRREGRDGHRLASPL